METTNTQQQSEMHAKPQKEHQWLQKLVGEWTYEGEAEMGPDQPSEPFSGTETIRTLGELWVLAVSRGTMPGGSEDNSLSTLGYDPDKERFVGTWIGSMMPQLWIYHDAEFDASTDTLALISEGPDMIEEGKSAQYKDVITLEGADQRTMTAFVQDDEGAWHQFMEMRYQRKK